MPKPKSAAELREKNRAYERASLPCDLVLKGGAASGFVYSGTIVELAKATCVLWRQRLSWPDSWGRPTSPISRQSSSKR
jgi:hypothetical protein